MVSGRLLGGESWFEVDEPCPSITQSHKHTNKHTIYNIIEATMATRNILIEF